MTKVLIVATSRKTRGGITSVLKAHETGEQWKNFHCHWVQTHRDSSNVVKIGYFLTGFVDFLYRLPFYDVVYLHISQPITIMRKRPFLELAKRFGKKIIVHFHGYETISTIEGKDADAYKVFFDSADVIIVLSKWWKDKLVEILGINEDKIKILYNPCPPKIESLSKYIEEKRNYILYAGTVNKRKGYGDLIKAFANVSNNFPDWKVVFAGNGEIEEGKQLARDLGIEDKVEFVGWVSGKEKEKIFREAKVFCLPSYAEGFSMAVLDAWSFGLPVITTPVGGIPDIAVDGENLLMFEPGDVKMLAVQLEKILSDRELRKILSFASMKLASNEFFIDNINRQLGDIYESLSK